MEMAGSTGLSRQRIGEVMPEISESLKPAKTQLAKTGQIEEVAEAFNMPVNLAHALDAIHATDVNVPIYNSRSPSQSSKVKSS